MKLNEFHVGDGSACAPGHGHSVASGGIRVGGIEVDFSATAGSQHDTVGAKDTDLAGFLFEGIDAQHAVIGYTAQFAGGDEFNGNVIREDGEAGSVASGFQKRGSDLMTGGVLGVEDAALGVPTFPSEGVSVTLAVEGGAPGHQFLDGLRAFANDGAYVLLVAETRSSVEGVVHVLLDAVVPVAQAVGQDG